MKLAQNLDAVTSDPGGSRLPSSSDTVDWKVHHDVDRTVSPSLDTDMVQFC